jgi:hypothetical protein
MASTANLLAAVHNAFSFARPNRFTVDASDDEILRAEAMFASRTPETLQSSDIGIGAGWPEVWLTQSARDYYMPGFARLVLDNDGFDVCDFFDILSPDRIAAFDEKQKNSIADVLEFIRDELCDHDKEILNRRLKRLRN